MYYHGCDRRYVMCDTRCANNMQPSEEIKSRLDIVEVIREYIPVKAAGVNFRAQCPFHREKTPSLMISPDKQIWHCFGCGKGGDIFAFVMEMEGLDFVEALRLLAPKAGVTLKKEDPKMSSQRNRLLDILEQSRRFYHRVLLDGAQAQAAREYLRQRGVDEDTIEEWQIGYSPDTWEATLGMLKKSGFQENEIFLAGMSVSRQAGGPSENHMNRPGFYDRFRGRIMFPINDLSGNTVAFSARVSPEKEATEKMGKYINSPQTMIYDKSRILYGLDKAKTEIKKHDLAIMVEGQMDAITAHQFGFKNVIASSGTALTAEQVALLKRYSVNVALAFDRDEAGAMAADRGIREAMQAEMNIKVIEVPAGKDPDECIRHSPDAWQAAVAAAKPMMRYYFDKTLKPLDLSDLSHRRQAARQLLPVIAKLGNKIEQDYWLKELCENIDVKEALLRETLMSSLPKTRPGGAEDGDSRQKKAPAETTRSREERLSELFLAMLLRFPALIDRAIDHLPIEQLIGENNRFIYKYLLLFYNSIREEQNAVEITASINWGYRDFKLWLENNQPAGNETADQLRYLDRLALLGDNEYFEHSIEQTQSESLKIILILRKHYLHERLREIEKLIAQAEKDGDAPATEELINEFKVLSDEMREISD